MLNAQNNGTTAAPPIGIIGSYWGGTMVNMWIKNSTNAECKNAASLKGNPSYPCYTYTS